MPRAAAQRACATSLHVLTTSRCSHVENCDSPRNWCDPPHELHERLLGRVARVVGVAQDVQRDPVDALGMPVAERLEGALVSVFRSPDENGVGQPVVDERPVGPQVTDDSTGAAGRRLHAPTLVCDAAWLLPHTRAGVVEPALRGAYGREYYWAAETTTTQRMLPRTRRHGAVALAERQTEGRGRLGRTWVDSAPDVLGRALSAAARRDVARADARRGAVGRRGDRARRPGSSTRTTCWSTGARSPASWPRRATRGRARDRDQRRRRRRGPARPGSTATASSCSSTCSTGSSAAYDSWLSR